MQETKHPNDKKIFVYQKDCIFCGSNGLENLVEEAKTLGFILEAKQTPLYTGWKMEAERIGGEIPFVYCHKTRKLMPLKEAKRVGLKSITE